MSLPIPPLDDLDFEALMEQARSFIPRYAPAWTDHNLHDPGITLLELAAWLVDQQLYRVGFVSDRHIRAFAALLGIKPEHPTPAQGLVWPEQADTPSVQSATALAQGTRVSCLDQPDIAFELAEAVYLTPTRFAQQQAMTVRSGVFLAAAASHAPIIPPSLPQTNSSSGELELVFDQPLVTGNVDTGIISLGIDLAADNITARLSQSPGGHLLADYRTGTDTPWEQVRVVQDTTFALNQTGILLLSIPPKPLTTYACLRIRPIGRTNPLPPRIRRLELNVLPIIQTSTVPQTILGVSNGLPDQTFPLNSAGLVSSVRADTDKCQASLCVDILGDDTAWKETPDLSQAEPERVFQLDSAHKLIRFGNGVNGKIPPKGSQIRHSSYKLTQGQGGNLQAGLGWTVAGVLLPSGQSRFGSNRAPLYGGSDVWDMERLIAATRQAALERTALLGNAELAAAATALTGMSVDRASVLPGFHPAFPQRKVRNARALVVIPQQVQAGDTTLAPDPDYFRNLQRLLQPRQVLGERLSVLPARVVWISIQAEILCADGIDPTEAVAEAGQRLQARFTAATRRNPWQIQPWPVGRDVRQAEVKALLAETSGTVAVTRCVIARAGTAPDNRQVITLQADEVAMVADDGFSITPLASLQQGGS